MRAPRPWSTRIMAALPARTLPQRPSRPSAAARSTRRSRSPVPMPRPRQASSMTRENSASGAPAARSKRASATILSASTPASTTRPHPPGPGAADICRTSTSLSRPRAAPKRMASDSAESPAKSAWMPAASEGDTALTATLRPSRSRSMSSSGAGGPVRWAAVLIPTRSLTSTLPSTDFPRQQASASHRLDVRLFAEVGRSQPA